MDIYMYMYMYMYMHGRKLCITLWRSPHSESTGSTLFPTRLEQRGHNKLSCLYESTCWCPPFFWHGYIYTLPQIYGARSAIREERKSDWCDQPRYTRLWSRAYKWLLPALTKIPLSYPLVAMKGQKIKSWEKLLKLCRKKVSHCPKRQSSTFLMPSSYFIQAMAEMN